MSIIFFFFYLCVLVNGQMTLMRGLGSSSRVHTFTITRGIHTVDLNAFYPRNVTHMMAFVISPYYEVSIATTRSFEGVNDVTGTSLGIVFLREPHSRHVFYLKSIHSARITIWIGVNMYNRSQPIPGWCADRNSGVSPAMGSNLLLRQSQPKMEYVDFDRAALWNHKEKLTVEPCGETKQFRSLYYHLYAIPIANLGGQRWPPWNRSFEEATENDGSALDVTRWPLSPSFVAQQLLHLLSPSDIKKYGQHLDSYPRGIDESPTRFVLSRRYANVYAAVVLVEYQGCEPVVYAPQMIYACPDSSQSSLLLQHYNSSWQCNEIFTSGRGQSIACGVAIALAAILFYIIAYYCPRFASLLCLYMALCIVTGCLIERLGGTQYYYSLLMGLLFGVLPVVALIYFRFWLPKRSPNKQISARCLTFWPCFLFVYLVCAAVHFTPLNRLDFLKPSLSFFPMFVVTHFVVSFTMTRAPVVVGLQMYSLSTGSIAVYGVVMGVTVAFVPQSLWYHIVMDYFLTFALDEYIRANRFNPVGIYDMFILGSYVVLTIFANVRMFTKWNRLSKQRKRTDATLEAGQTNCNTQNESAAPLLQTASNQRAGESQRTEVPASVPTAPTFEMQTHNSSVGSANAPISKFPDAPPKYEEVCGQSTSQPSVPPPYAV